MWDINLNLRTKLNWKKMIYWYLISVNFSNFDIYFFNIIFRGKIAKNMFFKGKYIEFYNKFISKTRRSFTSVIYISFPRIIFLKLLTNSNLPWFFLNICQIYWSALQNMIYIIYISYIQQKYFCGRIGIKRVRKFGKIKYYLVSKTLRLKGSPLQVSYNTVRKPVANKFNVW